MEFKNLNINSKLIQAVAELGFTETTAIQEKCIPEILAGKDVFGQSSTGSGKTAAFGLPILQRMQQNQGLQVLILTPTRELCVQVTDSLRSFAKYMKYRIISVYGGVSIQNQFEPITTADIIVATPGRVLDHLERRTLKLNNIQYFVLDEADKMFEMGFVEAVEQILRHIPKQRQTLLFSATFPQSVMHVVRRHMHNPVSIKAEIYVDKSLLKQVYYDIKPYEKFSLLTHLLRNETPGLSIVFCATRHEANMVARNLKANSIKVMAIHGGLTQNKRLHALNSLKNNQITVLVATDVAARGLDIKNVSHVYNYDVPKTSEEYVHRIGRTARAGEEGNAVTLLTERDHDNFSRVLRDRTLQIVKEEVPVYQKVFFNAEREHSRFTGHYGKRGFHERRHGSFSGGSSGSYGRSRDHQSGERSNYIHSSGTSGGFQRSSSGFRGRSHTRSAGNSGNWRR